MSGVREHRGVRRQSSGIRARGRRAQAHPQDAVGILRSEIGDAHERDRDQTEPERPQTGSAQTRRVRFINP